MRIISVLTNVLFDRFDYVNSVRLHLYLSNTTSRWTDWTCWSEILLFHRPLCRANKSNGKALQSATITVTAAKLPNYIAANFHRAAEYETSCWIPLECVQFAILSIRMCDKFWFSIRNTESLRNGKIYWFIYRKFCYSNKWNKSEDKIESTPKIVERIFSAPWILKCFFLPRKQKYLFVEILMWL